MKFNADPWLSDNGSIDYWPVFLRKWKPVQHYIRWTEPPHVDGERYLSWGSPGLTGHGAYTQNPMDRIPALLAADHAVFRSRFGTFGSHIEGLSSLTEEAVDGGFVPKPTGLSILVDHALKSMLPNMKSEMSLINTLIELKDLGSLPRTLSNISDLWGRLFREGFTKNIGVTLSYSLEQYSKSVRRLKGRWRRVRKTFRPSHGPTLRELFRAAGDAYLQKEFNIMPLLRDVSVVYNALTEVDKRLRRLLNQSGRVHMKHYSFEWQEVASPSVELVTTDGYLLDTGQFAGSTNPPGQTGCYNSHALGFKATRRVTHYQPTTFHAQVEFNYHFTQLQLEHAQVFAMLDHMGINLNPSIIWNAIPWSFVIDWVISVSSWLNGRASMNMEPTINMSRFLWSWERFRRISVSVFTYQKGLNVPPTIETHLPTMYETTYRRDVEKPTRENTALFGSGLNSKELSFGIALATTRGKYRTNRGR